jgi:tRNA-Thr(GGU) m(6)t(6)A37 methyltransferase TsaA
MKFEFAPIGTYMGTERSKAGLPRQAHNILGNTGYIQLLPEFNAEQVFDSLNTFSHIWILFVFHQAKGWKNMVLPPRGRKKRGIFATRSPYRPVPIGMSAASVLSIEKRKIYVQGADLLNGTPVLDIKPYLPYADSIPNAYGGWTEEIQQSYSVHLQPYASQQLDIICQLIDPNLKDEIMNIIRDDPYPHPYRRIETLDKDLYLLSIRLWRIIYKVVNNTDVYIESIALVKQANSLETALYNTFTAYFPDAVM